VNDYLTTATNDYQGQSGHWPKGLTMSIKTKFAALAFGALAFLADASFGASKAQSDECKARPYSHYCVGAQIGGGTAPKKCYWLPTASNGRVTGVQRVCS
jgi:hypothetical protein